MLPRITAFYAALAALLVVVLVIRVVVRRFQLRVGIGDNGDKVLARRIRAHGNAVEFLPLALLLLLLLELLAILPLWLHVFGASLLIGRLLHAWGLSRSAGPGMPRLAGTVLTLASVIAMSVVLLWQSVLWWMTTT